MPHGCRDICWSRQITTVGSAKLGVTRRLDAGSHVRPKPPALSSVIRAFRRGVRPPQSSELLTWARAHTSASQLADLARDFLRPTDALTIERLLRTGRHEKPAQHFCDRFSARWFPLEYVWTGGRADQLLPEVTGGIQHERYGENWEEIGDLWSLKPVFLLSLGTDGRSVRRPL
jgi:hypothetical protein